VLVIALDGPAGTGKSTVARALAERLGVAHLDTGAMYRAVTWAALRAGLDATDPADRAAVGDLARRVRLEVDAGPVRVDGVDVTADIRGPEVTAAVSAVSAIPAVRAELRDRQRAWMVAHRGGVAEGRDMGTVVFPHAQLKVFLTASSDVRARRRAAELAGDVEAIARDIERRDRADSTRADSPLQRADDAVVVDTSELRPDQIVDLLVTRLDNLTPAD
jgi:CMP/dCMP kinase